MKRILVSWAIGLLLVGDCVFAQPVHGPWMVDEGYGLTSFQIVARDDSTAFVFYQIDDETRFQILDVVTGQSIGEPVVLSEPGAGFTRTITDAVRTDSGWVVSVYDLSATHNNTAILHGSDSLQLTIQVDSSPNYSSFGSSGTNDHVRLAGAGSNAVVVTWIDYWLWVSDWFSESGVGFYAMRFNLPETLPSEFGAYDGAFFDDGWAINADSDSPIAAGVSQNELLCLGSLYNGSEWALCGWLEGYQLECYCSPLAWLTDDNGTILMLSNSGTSWQGYFDARILDVDTTELTCTELSPIEHTPIAATSDPAFGFAWLSLPSSGLMLARATAAGESYLPEGVVYWPDPEYRVVNADMTISVGGRIFALWKEAVSDSPGLHRLCVAAVDWDTPLSNDDSRSLHLPSKFHLAAYPNPFNSEVQIEYSLPTAGDAKLFVYNIQGQLVDELLNGRMTAGERDVTWTPTSGAGVYFVSLQAGNAQKTQKVLYLK